MVKQIIPAFSKNQYPTDSLKSNQVLEVAEFFCDTIQGEGQTAGVPATFLRLKGCTLNCRWCDSEEVWRQGDEYGFHQLFALMEEYDVIEKLRLGQHFILTGGSPLRQQHNVIMFFLAFYDMYKFVPIIEVENECVIRPYPEMIELVSYWNNSPKLSNSGNTAKTYIPTVIQDTAKLSNSTFKFVVDCEEDWQEILTKYLQPKLITKQQIILMPQGDTREALEITRPIAAKMAMKYNVRFSDRLHITLWDKKTGV